jgi:hypothetical protein
MNKQIEALCKKLGGGRDRAVHPVRCDGQRLRGTHEAARFERWVHAKRAVASAVERKPFRALTTARPFQITATPGHDVPKLTLLAL